jgi:hypothetical protein
MLEIELPCWQTPRNDPLCPEFKHDTTTCFVALIIFEKSIDGDFTHTNTTSRLSRITLHRKGSTFAPWRADNLRLAFGPSWAVCFPSLQVGPFISRVVLQDDNTRASRGLKPCLACNLLMQQCRTDLRGGQESTRVLMSHS